ETIQGCHAATELYGTVFKPTVHKEIYPFEDLGRAFEEMHKNTQTGIPILRVAEDMPESVKGLVLWAVGSSPSWTMSASPCATSTPWSSGTRRCSEPRRPTGSGSRATASTRPSSRWPIHT